MPAAETTTIHPDAHELASLLKETWPLTLERLRASGVPLNVDPPPAAGETTQAGTDAGTGATEGGGTTAVGTDAATAATGEQPAAAGTDAGEDGLPDAIKAILTKERNARRAAERKASQLETRVGEFEDRDKTELQKAVERAERAEREAVELRSETLRARVAAKHSLPAELADVLKGDTEEALDEHAQRLAALVKPAGQPAGSGFDGGSRGSGGSTLTRAQIEAMSPDELNRRWPEIQEALKRL
jgi:hypothetical protein